VDELHSRPRVVAQQQVPVEVYVVAETRDLRAGRDRQPGLVHASEHDAEPEGAGDVGDADGLADPARLRELDVHPVGALEAAGNVGGDVAVLVDEDGKRRALLELGPIWVAGPKRLL